LPQVFHLPTPDVATPSALGKTLNRIFSAPEAARVDPRVAALQQLEAAGLPATGDALVRTVATGHRPLVELLLTAGVDVNAVGAGNRTALLTATLAKDWGMANYLLEMGADINRADGQGVTPLMAVTSSDRKDVLQKLVSKGAALDAQDLHGHTALHYAVAARNADGLTTLLRAGADPKVDGSNLMASAFETQDWQIVQPVLERQPSELKWNTHSRTLLQQSIGARDAQRTKLLLTKHPAAPTPEGLQQPLLAYTLLHGNLPQFKFLLECGANPDTLLNTPAEKSFIEKVQGGYLRHYLGSEPGMTVLMMAAGMGQKPFVEELLNRGAKRGLGTEKHRMPATVFAARAGEHTDTLQLLLGKDSPKPEELRVEISLGSQRASLIKNGVTVMSTSVSTGRSGFSTPTGKYVVTDKHRSHMSSIYEVKMPFFMRLSYRDFGMHQGVVPGYPASHGCIRVPSGNIQKLFSQVPVGTLVTIY
jgi:ankyrin repeat protein